MTFWQSVDFASTLLFIILFLLCLQRIAYWVTMWQDARNKWHYLYKYLHLPIKANRRGRPSMHSLLFHKSMSGKVVKCLWLVLIVLVNCLLYYDILRILSSVLSKHYPLLVVPNFTLGLAILYLMEPFIVIGLYTIGYSLYQTVKSFTLYIRRLTPKIG